MIFIMVFFIQLNGIMLLRFKNMYRHFVRYGQKKKNNNAMLGQQFY